MKKINSLASIMAIATMSAFLMSCSPKAIEKQSTGKLSEIYGVVFDAEASRTQKGSDWYKTSGIASALMVGEEEGSGKLSIYFADFSRPQFCTTGECGCSGIAVYNFTSKQVSSGEDSSGEDKPYNVWDPYEDGKAATDTGSDNKEILPVFGYILSLTAVPEETNLNGNCPSILERDITITRYQAGQIVMRDESRDTIFAKRAAK